jgi:catechol 2,3-dioxygenase-like lactoylglutathione lyase family enzyme
MDLRLELVTIPVADVERAKTFYVDQVGFTVEQDVQVDEHHRFVELVPPGSPCSIAVTTGYMNSEPGSVKGLQLNVDDADEVHAVLRSRHVEVSDIGEHPWGRFCFFSDPDGNGWSIHGPTGG